MFRTDGVWGTLLILGWLSVHRQHLRVEEANRGVRCFRETLRTDGRPLRSLAIPPVQAEVKVELSKPSDHLQPAPNSCQRTVTAWL